MRGHVPERTEESPGGLDESVVPTAARGAGRAPSARPHRTGWVIRLWDQTDRPFRRAAGVILLLLLGSALPLLVLEGRTELAFARLTSPIFSAVAVGTCVWAGLRNHGAERAWRLLIAAMIMANALAGGAIARDVINGGPALPSMTPLALLALTPTVCGLAALLCFPSEPYDHATRARVDGANRRLHVITVLDGLIVVGAVALLCWVLILNRALDSPVSPGLPGTLAVAAVATLLIVLVILTAAFRRPRSPLGLVLVGSGIMLFCLSVMSHMYAGVRGLADVPRVLDLGFGGSGLLLALAALLRPGGPVPATGRLPPDRWETAAVETAAAVRVDGRAAVGAGSADGTAAARSPARHRWWHGVLPYIPLLVGGAFAVFHLQPVSGSLDRDLTLWGLLGLLLLAVLRQMTTMADNAHLLTQLEGKQHELHHLAFHDPLTGLANRALFVARLNRALADRRLRPHRVSLLFCDLDGFKGVNDRFGHAAGDELLCVVAARLAGQVRPDDSVARLGGDEFAILLESDSRDPEAVGRRLTRAVRAPIQLRSCPCRVDASVGLVTVEEDAGTVSAEALLHRADLAMYHAKATGGGQVTVFRPELAEDGHA
ncbi:diguanylate cyclase (GGDEF) domain-containing protein [Parafrankia irregularis]|uniref:Diguanylate cyclase (GGDEF) domain-containing protein n=2 Tax=Parafrankia TaxID=2994362 RepID=A0A0S4QPR3_9ACTN|nr:GGDEF domain-containing protein [Parafrankia irregularis]MBE3206106.1 GGDEF domain-containing protein [Parafrankia sp. CH37]CUU57010.1 diguanylate cyclase (GGDEF) domain-containing protein [Parafrankia irregularis]